MGIFLAFWLLAGTLFAEPESRYLFVTSPNTSTITVVDVAQSPMTIAGEIDISGSPYGIAKDPTNRYLYVVCQSDNTLKRLDTSNLSSAPVEIPLTNDGKLANLVLISPDGKYAFVLKSDTDNSSLDVINIEDLNASQVVYNTGTLTGPSLAMTVTADSQLLYIGTASGLVYALNLSNFELNSPFLGGVGISSAGISSSKGVVFVLSVSSPTSITTYFPTYDIPPTTGGAAFFDPSDEGIPTSVCVLANGLKAYASIAAGMPVEPDNKNGVLEIEFGDDPMNLISYPSFLEFTTPIVHGPSTICINSEETILYLPCFHDNQLAKVNIPLNTGVEYLSLDSPFQSVFALTNIDVFPAPPRSVKGKQLVNQFLFEHELFNRITWLPSTSQNITSYYVRKNEELVQIISPQSPLQYEEHNLSPGLTISYSITAVNQNNLESTPVVITISGTP
jgi:DNA-binding beta-propeller fold protein YncE